MVFKEKSEYSKISIQKKASQILELGNVRKILKLDEEIRPSFSFMSQQDWETKKVARGQWRTLFPRPIELEASSTALHISMFVWH